MTNRLSTLILAAAVAASLPAAASAGGGCDHGGAAPYPWAPPAAYPTPPAPPRPAPREWRERSWRERELAEVRAELRALDAERARFYAEYGRRPGKVRKFERWHQARRAELERRWHELQWVAWR